MTAGTFLQWAAGFSINYERAASHAESKCLYALHQKSLGEGDLAAEPIQLEDWEPGDDAEPPAMLIFAKGR